MASLAQYARHYSLFFSALLTASFLQPAAVPSLRQLQILEETAYEIAQENPDDQSASQLFSQMPTLATTLSALASKPEAPLARGLVALGQALGTNDATPETVIPLLLEEAGTPHTIQHQVCQLLTIARAALLQETVGLADEAYVYREATEKAAALAARQPTKRRWLKKRYLLLGVLCLGLVITITVGIKGYLGLQEKMRRAEKEAVRVAQAEKLQEALAQLAGELEKLKAANGQLETMQSKLQEENGHLRATQEELVATAKDGLTKAEAATRELSETYQAVIIDNHKRFSKMIEHQAERAHKIRDAVQQVLDAHHAGQKMGAFEKFFTEPADVQGILASAGKFTEDASRIVGSIGRVVAGWDAIERRLERPVVARGRGGSIGEHDDLQRRLRELQRYQIERGLIADIAEEAM